MTQQKTKKHPRGVVAIEAALVLPVLIFITLGGMQYGWLFLKYQEITNVARHYVRYAVRPGANYAALETAMINELALHGISVDDIDGNGTRIAWVNSSATEVGDPLYAQVTLNTAKVDIINFFPVPDKLIAHATMSKEGE